MKKEYTAQVSPRAAKVLTDAGAEMYGEGFINGLEAGQSEAYQSGYLTAVADLLSGKLVSTENLAVYLMRKNNVPAARISHVFGYDSVGEANLRYRLAYIALNGLVNGSTGEAVKE